MIEEIVKNAVEVYTILFIVLGALLAGLVIFFISKGLNDD